MKQIRNRIQIQQELPIQQPTHFNFPPTRYQGSKLKLLDWIRVSIEHLEFDTALDLFGGTGCVAYMFKTMGKEVTYNDILRSNQIVGNALIVNKLQNLLEAEMEELFRRHPRRKYDDFIERTFEDIYFTVEENRWLDIVAQNISYLKDEYKQSLAYYALFQASTGKRPYNLFHRANLYMRTSNVNRSFGNKATWDKSFEEHFRQAALLANNAIFDNCRKNRSLNLAAHKVPTGADLVYIDTPYMSTKGVGVDYREFYHFLEGLCEYGEWPNRVDENYKHKPYKRQKSPWCDKKKIQRAFEDIFSRFSDSILVVSYRDNGIPSPDELKSILRQFKKRVYIANNTSYKYVLSKTASRELLIIAE